jgi:hypothetical protein
MSELTTRARERGQDSDQDSLDSLERAQWRSIGARVEALKIDDMKPPPPIGSESESIGVGKTTLTKEQALLGKNFQLRKQVKTPERENEELKREISRR